MAEVEIVFTSQSLGMTIGARAADNRAVVVTVKDGGAAESGGAMPGMLIAKVRGPGGAHTSLSTTRPSQVNGEAMTSFDEARRKRPVYLRSPPDAGASAR